MNAAKKKVQPLTRATQVLLYCALVSLGMGQTIVFAILPMLGRELGFDLLTIDFPALGLYFQPKELAITTLIALTSLAFFWGATFWGRRSDVVGRKPIILVGLLGYSIGTYIFIGAGYLGLAGIVTGFLMYSLFALTRAGLVWFMCATVPSSSAFVIDSVPIEKRTAHLSRLNSATQIGTMLGPAFAAFVVFGFLAPFFVHATFTLLVAIAIFLWLPESEKSFTTKKVPSKLRFLDPRYRRYLFISLICFTMLGMVQMTLGFYFEDRLGLPREEAVLQFSFAMVASSSAMLFAQLFVVQRWHTHPLNLLKTGLPIACLAYLLIANANQTTLLLSGMALYGFGMGLAIPGFMVAPTLTVAPEEQGALAGLNSSIPAVGFILGPLMGGLIYKLSPDLTYWIAAVVIGLLWLYSLTMKNSTTKPTAQ